MESLAALSAEAMTPRLLSLSLFLSLSYHCLPTRCTALAAEGRRRVLRWGCRRGRTSGDVDDDDGENVTRRAHTASSLSLTVEEGERDVTSVSSRTASREMTIIFIVTECQEFLRFFYRAFGGLFCSECRDREGLFREFAAWSADEAERGALYRFSGFVRIVRRRYKVN